MTRLPPLSGRETISALERLGFVQLRQRGSHVVLRRGDATCVVPLHRELKRGTLAGVLAQADLRPDEFASALK
jgi:predicted RNA binding protein YcfA (HicA-like mRNA interferase family)